MIKTTKKDLLGAITAAYKAVPAKASIPIMECFRLKAAQEQLEVSATDGSLSIFAYAPAEGDELACINAKMLLDAVRLLPDTDIEITLGENTATVNYGTGHFSLPTFDVQDFPNIDVESFGDATVIPGDTLKDAIGYVLPSVAKDPMRPVLNGIYFNPVDGGLDLVASDAHTLSMQTLHCDVKTGAMIVPLAAATFVKDYVKDEDDVLLGEQNGKAVFSMGNAVIAATIIVGNFPKYESVIPKNNESLLTAPTAELIGTVRRVATCANKASNTIKFDLKPFGGCNVEAQDLGFGCAAKEEMTFAEYNGQEMQIGFKHDLLSNLLSVIGEDEVKMSFDNPKRAALLTSERENRKALIMPVAVS